MAKENDTNVSRRESIFLNEHFMVATCIFIVLTGVASMVLCLKDQYPLAVFEILTKLVTAVAMYLAFRFFKWDVAVIIKGLVQIGQSINQVFYVFIGWFFACNLKVLSW